MMVASIGPFWDANETWLVLGVGILLVAFPHAHGVILTALYLPVAMMLIALILRGVAFEFRAKATGWHQQLWNRLFFVGSLGAAIAQGMMLGGVVTGFQEGPLFVGFELLVGLGLAGGYALLGATWLVIKTEGDLQARALRWGKGAVFLAAAGIAAISLATPFASANIMEKWFEWPRLLWLSPLAHPDGRCRCRHPSVAVATAARGKQARIPAFRARGLDFRVRVCRVWLTACSPTWSSIG